VSLDQARKIAALLLIQAVTVGLGPQPGGIGGRVASGRQRDEAVRALTDPARAF
jgi:hypothetical protein